MKRRGVEIDTAAGVANRLPREPEHEVVREVKAAVALGVPFPSVQLSPGQFAAWAVDEGGKPLTTRQIPAGTRMPLIYASDLNVIVGSIEVSETSGGALIAKGTLILEVQRSRELLSLLKQGGARFGLTIRPRPPRAASLDPYPVSEESVIQRVV